MHVELRSTPMPFAHEKADDDTLLGFTVIDLPVLQPVAFPFLLTREG